MVHRCTHGVAVGLVLLPLFFGVDYWMCEKAHDDEHMVVFLKHHPSMQIDFRYPTSAARDTAGYRALDACTRRRVNEYCDIRYGTRDVEDCWRRTARQRAF